MAIRVLGGQVNSYALRTPVHIADTFSAVATVGQLVAWSTSSNFAVNSTAANALTADYGILVHKDNSHHGTVEWLRWNNLVEFYYSSVAPTLGHMAEVGSLLGSSVRGSSNATEAVHNRIVASDHISGKCVVVYG